jgi:hypothetical protein
MESFLTSLKNLISDLSRDWKFDPEFHIFFDNGVKQAEGQPTEELTAFANQLLGLIRNKLGMFVCLFVCLFVCCVFFLPKFLVAIFENGPGLLYEYKTHRTQNKSIFKV